MTEQERNRINRLIGEIASGSEAALEELYALYGGRVFSVAKNIIRDRQAAEDVVQETFIRVVKYASGFTRGDNGAGWICRIARNAALTYLRKRGQAAANIDEFRGLYDMGADIGGTDTKILVHTALSKLNAEERRLIYLRYYCDMTVRQLADEMNLPKSTAEYALKKAEEALKRQIGGEYI